MPARSTRSLAVHARGVSSIEYVLIASLVAIVCIGAWTSLGGAVETQVVCAARALDGGVVCTTGEGANAGRAEGSSTSAALRAGGGDPAPHGAERDETVSMLAAALVSTMVDTSSAVSAAILGIIASGFEDDASPEVGEARRDERREARRRRARTERRRERREWSGPLGRRPLVVNSDFGPRPAPCSGCSTFHQGTDFDAPQGAGVRAPFRGRVESRGWCGGGGNCITIRHPDGTRTRYMHLRSFSVRVGEHVDEREKIGTVGSTGNVTGPHLHFEVWRTPARPIDPVPFLRRHGVRVRG